MDFSDELREFTTRIERLKDKIATEEATKTSMVLPFFQLLGYDIFNPLEFIPEYTADAGTKKGEKVDYAIMRNNDPIMIVEVKPVNMELSQKHINQLFRYFTVTKARFGILTNGVIYRFYSDLEETNKMDLSPFLEINLLDMKTDSIKELCKFKKEHFDMKGILDSASELKYTSLLKNAIAEQFNDPSEQFVRALIKNIYSGVKTQAVVDKFKDLTLVAMHDYISDLLNEKFKNVMSSDATADIAENTQNTEYEFLPLELETLDFVKELARMENVSYKKTMRYAYMYVDGYQSKWVCRVTIKQDKNLFTLHGFESSDYETEYLYDDIELLEQIEELIVDTYKKCRDM